MEIKKIGFGDEGQVATADLLARLPAFQARALAASPALSANLDRTRRGLDTLQALDRQHVAGRVGLADCHVISRDDHREGGLQGEHGKDGADVGKQRPAAQGKGALS